MRRVILGDGPVRIPPEVFEGLEAVRRSGLTNMLDRPRVAELAEILGFEEAAEWVRANRGDYATGVFRGFVAEIEEEVP
jgi:hypothetical protein